MGLDARVFCDCIEKGRLHTPHPFPEWLIVGENGEPDVRTEDLPSTQAEAILDAHLAWEWTSPCDHKECVWLHHRLGNIGLVALLRQAVGFLAWNDADFFVLRFNVLYSGIHSGDFLNRDQVELLAGEICELQKRDWSKLNGPDADFLRDFLARLNELIEASRAVNKPIAF